MAVDLGLTTLFFLDPDRGFAFTWHCFGDFAPTRLHDYSVFRLFRNKHTRSSSDLDYLRLRVCPRHSVFECLVAKSYVGWLQSPFRPSCSRGTTPRLLRASQQLDGSHWAILRVTRMVSKKQKTCLASTIHVLKRRSLRICLFFFSGGAIGCACVRYTVQWKRAMCIEQCRTYSTYTYIYIYSPSLTKRTCILISTGDTLS